MASDRHHHLVGCLAGHRNAAGPDLGMSFLGQRHRENHRKHRFPRVLGEFGMTEPIQHGHNRISLQEHYHDHGGRILRSHQPQEKQRDRRELPETCHNLDILDEVHPWHHKVLQDSHLHRTVGIGSCKQHNRGWSSMDGHMGSFQLGVAAGVLVGEERLEQLLVAEFEWLGLELYGHWFGLLQPWRNVTGSAGQHFGGIGMSSLPVDHYNRCTIVVELQDRLADPVIPAANHIVDCSSFDKRCAAGGPRCSTKKTVRVRRRKPPTAVVSGTGIVGLDNPQMSFERKEPGG